MLPVLRADWRLRRTGTLFRLLAIPVIRYTLSLALPSVNLHAYAGHVARGVWSMSYLEGFLNRAFKIGQVFIWNLVQTFPLTFMLASRRHTDSLAVPFD